MHNPEPQRYTPEWYLWCANNWVRFARWPPAWETPSTWPPGAPAPYGFAAEVENEKPPTTIA